MTPLSQLDIFRSGDRFLIPSAERDRSRLMVTASTVDGWDHVTVAHPDRLPTQAEMRQVFRLFFQSDETAVQFFSDHAISDDAVACLHLWRPQDRALLPPTVGAPDADAQA